MMDSLKQVDLSNQKQYRIIPSVFPPINFFEDLVDPSEMETLFEIEGMTNPRLRQEAGNIFLVSKEDRVSGPGSSVIMAAFTHIGKSTRFSNGDYGVYYAGLTLETAIRETVFHREAFLRATNEDPCEITMRAYEGLIVKSLYDIRAREYKGLHQPDSYVDSQQFGSNLREKKSWGLIYNSVRHHGGTCIAAFRPPAVSIPIQTSHLRYCWNGKKIEAVLDTKMIMHFDESESDTSTSTPSLHQTSSQSKTKEE